MVSAPSKPTIPPAAQLLYDTLEWEPTGPEMENILASRFQATIVRGGEGAGKSEVAEKYLLGRYPDDMARFPDLGTGSGPPLLYWLVGDTYDQVSEEYRRLEMDLKDNGFDVQAKSLLAPGIMTIHFQGERFPRFQLEVKSGQDPSRISRQRPQGIIICEAGQVDHLIFDRCYGRAMQGGGWILLVGTLEGSVGWYPQLADVWESGIDGKKTFELATWTNKHLYPGGRSDPKILQLERESSDEYFMERIAGKRVPPRGLVFQEFRADLHVSDVSYDPDFPIHIWEDPGYGASSAHALMFAQYIDGQVRIFDEIYDRGILTNEIIHKAQMKPFWNAQKHVVSDPHYKDQHHSVHSVSDVWLAEAGLVCYGERVRILPGIERMKTFLKPDALSGRPGLVIAPHCQGILSEFGAALDPFDNKSYHPYKWKEDRYGDISGTEPEDKYNHAVKAVIYGLIYNFGYAIAQESRIVKVKKLR